MLIIDRYIVKETLGPLLFGVAAFASVFIGSSTLFRIAQIIAKNGPQFSSVAKLFMYSLPPIVVLTFPMAMLLASLLVFGRLSSTSEITAMRNGGLSFLRLAMPVFVIAFAISVFSVWFTEAMVPAANAGYNRIVREEIQHNNTPRLQRHIVVKTVDGDDITRLTYARLLNPETRRLEDLTIQEFANNVLQRVVSAESAVWHKDKWIMYNGLIRDLTAGGNTAQVMTFQQQIMPLAETPEHVALEQKENNEMTITELKQRITILRGQYAPVSELEVELYQRVAVPMASLVFAMIGAPLGLQPNRSSSSIGLGLSIVIILVYYAIMMFTTALGQGGTIPPLLAAFTPDLVGMAAGCWLIWRNNR
ncbi:MAG: LptF/LptG family permease [Negativicutes bacterium]|nr:LptF/LptG family permease [Negativicutes bacterium]